MNRMIAIGAGVVLLLAAGAGWFLFGDRLFAPSEPEEPAAFVAGAPPVYVSIGRVLAPVFDAEKLIGNVMVDITLLVPDERAKTAVEARTRAIRDALMRDISDLAVLVALTGKTAAIDRVKGRLESTAAQVIGVKQPFRLLIEGYTYTPA